MSATKCELAAGNHMIGRPARFDSEAKENILSTNFWMITDFSLYEGMSQSHSQHTRVFRVRNDARVEFWFLFIIVKAY